MSVYRFPWNYASARRLQQRAAFSSPPPIFSAGPIAINLTPTGYDAQTIISKDCTLSILVSSSQPSDAAFDASAETIAVSAGVAVTLHHTGAA